MKLVLIEWIDSHAGRGWQDLEDIETTTEPLFCRSVGWLVSKKANCKTIVPHLAGERNENIILQGCGNLVIPNEAIKEIHVLKEPKR